jgi:preprotein translocase subunit YajC
MNSILPNIVLMQAAAGGNSTMQMLSTLVTFGLVFVIFYFLIIRPQNKKQKAAQKMIEAVKKGDKIVTIGGVHGIVFAVKETTVVVKVDDETRIEFSKSAVATVVTKAEEKAAEKIADKSAESAPSADGKK